MSKPDARLLVRQKAKRKTALRTNFLSMALKQISQRWNMSSFLLFLYLVLSFLSVTHYIVCFPPQKTFDSLQSAWCDVRRATSTKKVFPLSIFPLKKAQQLQMQHKGRSFSKDVELSFVVLGICPSVSLSSPPSAAFSTVMCFLYTPSSLFFFFFLHFSYFCSYKWQCRLPAPKTTTVTWRHFPKCTTSSIYLSLCLSF